ncbi:MAG: deoxyribodipyrimidine photolyase [Deltaproteobacteria bacterium]|nr:deoxyribodipyrimidine photolyase [Deltaproteobacteria bacterium]
MAKLLDQFATDARITVRNDAALDDAGSCVLYWMQRAQRSFDNAALNCAIDAANALGKPAVVFFRLRADAHHANLRHYQFMLAGIADIVAGLRKRRVGFVLSRDPDHDIYKFCALAKPCLVISEENPLRSAEAGRRHAAGKMTVPFWTVDADVIVPTRLLGKEHYAARTIRPKIHALLPQFLKPLSNPSARQRWIPHQGVESIDPLTVSLDGMTIDRSVSAAAGLAGGESQAKKTLERFLQRRLKGYATQRNHPDIDGTSQLSPYLHFGQIGPHHVALAVREAKAPEIDRRAFLEEFIVRRELAVNFVRFNPKYDSFDASEPWADRTLRQHASDARQYVYSEKQLENAETHDPLWNAAQKQMVLTGWMHGYLRMYWAKKILEWSPSPAQAFEIAVRLNDRYELDGRDPNGYAGIAWAIVGKHDRAWGPERQVYGKIRYMSYASTSRKFDSKAYIARIAAHERGGRAEV